MGSDGGCNQILRRQAPQNDKDVQGVVSESVESVVFDYTWCVYADGGKEREQADACPPLYSLTTWNWTDLI